MLSTSEIIEFSNQTLTLVLQGSTPAMLAAAVAGIAIAVLQALTQVQDQGLPTAVKFFAVMFILYMTYMGLASSVAVFSETLFERISTL